MNRLREYIDSKDSVNAQLSRSARLFRRNGTLLFHSASETATHCMTWLPLLAWLCFHFDTHALRRIAGSDYGRQKMAFCRPNGCVPGYRML